MRRGLWLGTASAAAAVTVLALGFALKPIAPSRAEARPAHTTHAQARPAAPAASATVSAAEQLAEDALRGELIRNGLAADPARMARLMRLVRTVAPATAPDASFRCREGMVSARAAATLRGHPPIVVWDRYPVTTADEQYNHGLKRYVAPAVPELVENQAVWPAADVHQLTLRVGPARLEAELKRQGAAREAAASSLSADGLAPSTDPDRACFTALGRPLRAAS